MRWSPLQAMFSMGASRAVPILAYHGIDDAATFERQLRYIRRRFRPVGLAEIIAALDGEALPPKALLVSFDDGDPSIFHVGLPLLRKYEVPAVAFVVTGLVGSTQMLWTKLARSLVQAGGALAGRPSLDADEVVRLLKGMDDERRIDALETLRRSATEPPPLANQMDWTELKAVDREGLMAIEDHSFSHPQLDRCSTQSVRDEIARSTALFESELGRRPRAFAYPDGAWSAEAPAMLGAGGYRAAFLFDHRRARVSGNDRWAVPRLRVNSTTTLDRFATILSGLHPAIHRLRGRR